MLEIFVIFVVFALLYMNAVWYFKHMPFERREWIRKDREQFGEW